MTKTAWLFLLLALACCILGLTAASQDVQNSAFIASGVSGSLFVLAMVRGRRIKFDPVLR